VSTPQSLHTFSAVSVKGIPLRRLLINTRQFAQRFGAFISPFDSKKICSSAQKTNDNLHSQHFNCLSLPIILANLSSIMEVSFDVQERAKPISEAGNVKSGPLLSITGTLCDHYKHIAFALKFIEVLEHQNPSGNYVH
jgi:hypothetical protein